MPRALKLPCGCRVDVDDLIDEPCDNHGQMRAEWMMRSGLDAELDERIKLLFGDRRFERSTVPLGNFEVKRSDTYLGRRAQQAQRTPAESEDDAWSAYWDSP